MRNGIRIVKGQIVGGEGFEYGVADEYHKALFEDVVRLRKLVVNSLHAMYDDRERYRNH